MVRVCTKPAIAAVAAFFTLAATATPSENTFAAVTNDWYNANFTNVYELAQQRLAANSNDVVGAYLMLDWDISFSDLTTMSNATTRLIENSDLVSNLVFSATFAPMRPIYVSFRDTYLPHQNEAMRQSEQKKAQRPHQTMPSKEMLELLWQCNLW